MTTTLITGATGFVAGWCIDEALKAGHKVIGTIRTQTKGDRLAEAFPDAIKSGDLVLETVSDVCSADEFKALFEKHTNIKYILHTASPFHNNAKDPLKEMMEPAIEGTTTVLKTAKAYAPTVEKIVVTSSLAAAVNMPKMSDPDFVLTEKDWNPISWEDATEVGKPGVNYVGSKKFAEKAAWDFIKEEKPKFTLTTVCPGYIFGPGKALDPNALNTSNETIVTRALDTKPDQTQEPMAMVFVDVRDCAKAHILGLSRKLDNQRLFLATSKFCTQQLLDIANKLPELKGKIATGNPADVEKQLNTVCVIDNSKTRSELNIDWIDLDKSVTDFANEWLSFQKK